jgi:ADP-ribose pyrophosphatase YjhB (NUDIX family)
MIVRSDLEKIAADYPEFKFGWKTTEYSIANPNFGEAKRVAVCKDDGTPIYDQYQIFETPSAISVPFYHTTGELNIGMIQSVRPLVKNAAGVQGNVASYELPRGFSLQGEPTAETIKRELGEETSSVVKSLRHIGHVNANTAFYTQNINVYAAEVYPDKVSRFKPDAKEKILKSMFYSAKTIGEMVMRDEIFCGLSKAALMNFFAYTFGFGAKKEQAAQTVQP